MPLVATRGILHLRILSSCFDYLVVTLVSDNYLSMYESGLSKVSVHLKEKCKLPVYFVFIPDAITYMEFCIPQSGCKFY